MQAPVAPLSPPPPVSLRAQALQALCHSDPGHKVTATHALFDAWQAGHTLLDTAEALEPDAGKPLPGRPDRPELLAPVDVPQRSPLMSVRLGATLILEKSFAFPHAIFERIREERVTGFPLVPTMAAMMAQMEGPDPGLFASLRYVTSAAAPLPVTHIERLRALFPHVQVFSMYGQTECTRAAWLPPAEIDRHPGSVGIAIPGTRVAVVDASGHPVPAGTVGELVVSGPHLMRGYWENPQATQQALRPDPAGGGLRLHTGDLFTADAQGFLTFVARKDDIIKSRGEKVAPKEVEAVLHALGGVSQALVIGVADPVLGQAIRALVVACDPKLSERDVIRHCARHLEDYMVPKSVEFRTFLPVTDTGKVSRRLAAAIPDQTGRS